MNKLLMPLFVTLCVLFAACGDDDEPKVVFSGEYLEATTWDAQLTGVQTPDPIAVSEHFVMQFLSKNSGDCIAAYGPTNYQGMFKYSITKEMIAFSGSIIGNWTVRELTANKIVLVSYQPKEHVLVLTRL